MDTRNNVLTRVLWLILLMSLSHWCSADNPEQSAPTPTLAIVGPQDNPQLVQFRNELKASLGKQWQLMYLPAGVPSDQLPIPSRQTVILTLGKEALQHVLLQSAATPDLPIISFYVNHRDFRSLAAEHATFTQLSAVFSDPPLARQVRLARLLKPRISSIGIMTYRAEPPPVLPSQGQPLIDVKTYALERWESLSKYLNAVIRSSDLMIGMEDPELFNSVNIKPILLTAYRHNKFVIGPNFSFVRAGSLATTYSSQADTVQEIQAILDRYLASQNWPLPDYASFFSVVVNTQVARSLNLVVDDNDSLQKALMTMEAAND
jgi:putative ABC transport system substrate-binding protein